MSWQKGSKWEKKIQKMIENGEYNGEKYECRRMPKAKYYAQDVFGHDLVCVNKNHWLLCQVKYRKDRLPPRRKKVIEEMTKTTMPDSSKRVLCRIDGRTNRIVWEEL